MNTWSFQALRRLAGAFLVHGRWIHPLCALMAAKTLRLGEHASAWDHELRASSTGPSSSDISSQSRYASAIEPHCLVRIYSSLEARSLYTGGGRVQHSRRLVSRGSCATRPAVKRLYACSAISYLSSRRTLGRPGRSESRVEQRRMRTRVILAVADQEACLDCEMSWARRSGRACAHAAAGSSASLLNNKDSAVGEHTDMTAT
ncbi:hypothetical protein OH77DRAFT_1416151 [Trametes cingulata]|nr:hypothetical protein OH77DRAFT_1416151 [Trametes cingulata]